MNRIHTRKKFVRPWTLPAAGAALVLLVAGCADGGEAGPISTSTPPVPSFVALTPNDHGYVRVESKSGDTRCSIASDLVACQTSADNWPRHADGRPFHCASVTADGDFHWVDADLGALEGRITMDYQTYRAQGWTISATSEETTFTTTAVVTAWSSAQRMYNRSDPNNPCYPAPSCWGRETSRDAVLQRGRAQVR